MTQLFANNATSVLASSASAAATSLVLSAGHGARFPSPTNGDFFLLTLYQMAGQTEVNHEIVKCTARSTDTLTVVRAQEGTTARAFNAADPVSARATAGSLSAKQDVIGYTPVQQGTGTAQQSNQVKIGWLTGNKLGLTIDVTDFGFNWPINVTGTAAGLSQVLPVVMGGTNSTATPTAGGVGYGTGTAHAYTALGTSGQFLKSNATAAPTWATLTLVDMPNEWVKKSVRVATTTALNANYSSNVLTAAANAALTVDGVALAVNDRILVKNQATAAHNGIYTVTNAGSSTTAYVLTRAADANASIELAGSTVTIDTGTVQGGDTWSTTFKTTDTLGTQSVYWYEVLDSSNLAGYLATYGIAGTGAAPGIVDLDDATVPAGQYYVSGSTTGGALPSGATSNGWLQHKVYGSAGFQLYNDYTQDQLWFRRRQTSTWRTWNRLLTGADITALPIKAYYESVDLSWAPGANIGAGHGLGVGAKLAVAYLRCQTADGGYSAGDVVLAPYEPTSNRGVSVQFDSASVQAMVGASGINILKRSSTAGTAWALNPAYWSIFFRVYA